MKKVNNNSRKKIELYHFYVMSKVLNEYNVGNLTDRWNKKISCNFNNQQGKLRVHCLQTISST